MTEKASGLQLFEKVDPSATTRGAPPIVFHPVPDSHIVFKTHEELKAWEDHVRTRLGVQLNGNLGTASESCCNGRTDDCD